MGTHIRKNLLKAIVYIHDLYYFSYREKNEYSEILCIRITFLLNYFQILLQIWYD